MLSWNSGIASCPTEIPSAKASSRFSSGQRDASSLKGGHAGVSELQRVETQTPIENPAETVPSDPYFTERKKWGDGG